MSRLDGISYFRWKYRRYFTKRKRGRKVSHSLAKKTAKEMLKNVKEKLGNICITPDTEVYTFLYYNACTLIGLKQYDLASDICIGLYKQLETINP